MNNVPRMRTLPECIAMLKELDPDTAVTLTALRRKVKCGELPSVEVGSKKLVNFDILLESLCVSVPAPISETGKIRRIDEKGARI